jgi:hypothetical protein
MTVGKVRAFSGRVACHAYKKPTVTVHPLTGGHVLFFVEGSIRQEKW